VARELKYFSPSTDLTALEKEIGHPSDTDDQYIDKWADLYDDEDIEDSEEESDETAEKSS
jgi:hypothetical protein